ncbi:MAG: acyl-CoA/acyl-ACP dehydrogenase [Halioglobus sp.]|nr:acyl-CoA/acyl-ACP dehydrogenase [Halioglobus sp.]
MAALSEEQAMIQHQAQSWVTKHAPVQEFRDVRDGESEIEFSPHVWDEMVSMGWAGIIIPEAYGGSNLGYLTFGLILEQLGRQLSASPLFASGLVGASAILLGGSESQKKHFLTGIADGSEIVTLALEEGPRHAPKNTTLTADAEAGVFTLKGNKTFVCEGMSATSYIVVARTQGNAGSADGITLFVIPADTEGIKRTKLSTVDSRGYANIQFNNVKVTEDAVLGKVGRGFGLLDPILNRARAGIAAEMLGTGSQAFEMTLEYLKTRVQFGQVIGSFQALGHRAAGFYSQKELAKSCVEAALQAIDANAENIHEMTSLSKCKVGEFLHGMSNELIQIHGGIGMTDEFDAGLYLKRARVLESSYGNQAYHRNRYAQAKGF